MTGGDTGAAAGHEPAGAWRTRARPSDVCRAFVARRVADGDPVRAQARRDHGGRKRWDRIRSWHAPGREAFATALLA
ncbi:hypothetical protein ACWGNN_19850 [Streptomyces sp. NPDC055817]